MATNVTDLRFDDGEDIEIVTTDQHVHYATALDLSHPAGVIFEHTESSVTKRLFVPYTFVQSINQVL